MTMEWKSVLENLRDAGCDERSIQRAEQLYVSGQEGEFLHFLRFHRCKLMESLHEGQRRIDCLDYLIRKSKAEQSKTHKERNYTL